MRVGGGNVVITVTDGRSWTMQLKAELARSDNAGEDRDPLVLTILYRYPTSADVCIRFASAL